MSAFSSPDLPRAICCPAFSADSGGSSWLSCEEIFFQWKVSEKIFYKRDSVLTFCIWNRLQWAWQRWVSSKHRQEKAEQGPDRSAWERNVWFGASQAVNVFLQLMLLFVVSEFSRVFLAVSGVPKRHVQLGHDCWSFFRSAMISYVWQSICACQP